MLLIFVKKIFKYNLTYNHPFNITIQVKKLLKFKSIYFKYIYIYILIHVRIQVIHLEVFSIYISQSIKYGFNRLNELDRSNQSCSIYLLLTSLLIIFESIEKDFD